MERPINLRKQTKIKLLEILVMINITKWPELNDFQIFVDIPQFLRERRIIVEDITWDQKRNRYVEMKGWNVRRKILLYVEMFKIVLAEGMIKSSVGLFIMWENSGKYTVKNNSSVSGPKAEVL